ncbi:hypothetical protein XCR1_1270004 [Xenorhabdus cabanillasii JM26]|uniref:Uncharacterized protein n=1 Tax=Xenorhabdus cabanillasii JM26 TaxID=1427517 RepID=W1IN01_9GAMM|nr:hypothetical protein XCR1_1270004 [Xenorhabdus cabanillasii JM26]
MLVAGKKNSVTVNKKETVGRGICHQIIALFGMDCITKSDCFIHSSFQLAP